jgi:site-specific DNA recombinase
MRIREDKLAASRRRDAVLYARVSSKEQEQGYSIPAQQELLRQYGGSLGLAIAQEFVDVESAKASGRPAFAAMIRFLKQHPECRVVLVEKTDRLYRNLKDYITVDDLDVEIHMVKENEVLSRSSRSSQKFMHGIRVLMAKNYIDNLSEEVKKGLHTKAAQHLWPSFAPPGYRNAVGETGKRIIVPDPVLGPIVTRLFGWFATGEYSLKALAQKAWAEGFRFRKSGSKIPISTLNKILRKRIYTGDFEYGGVTYRGSHQPLVTREVWDQVQAILDGRRAKKAGKGTRVFSYSGLLRCGHCECSLVGEVKKGRYVYYHCTGYRGKCGEPYTREEVIEQQIADALRELVVPPTIVNWLKTELLESDQTERAARAQTLRREHVEVGRLQARLEVLYEDRLDQRIDAATYDRNAEKIRQQQEAVRQRMQTAETPALPWGSDAADFMMAISQAASSFPEQDSTKRRDLLDYVVKNAVWKDGELRMSFKTPFAEISLSNRAMPNGCNELHGNSANFDNWRRGGDSNSRYP